MDDSTQSEHMPPTMTLGEVVAWDAYKNDCYQHGGDPLPWHDLSPKKRAKWMKRTTVPFNEGRIDREKPSDEELPEARRLAAEHRAKTGEPALPWDALDEKERSKWTVVAKRNARWRRKRDMPIHAHAANLAAGEKDVLRRAYSHPIIVDKGHPEYDMCADLAARGLLKHATHERHDLSGAARYTITNRVVRLVFGENPDGWPMNGRITDPRGAGRRAYLMYCSDCMDRGEERPKAWDDMTVDQVGRWAASVFPAANAGDVNAMALNDINGRLLRLEEMAAGGHPFDSATEAEAGADKPPKKTLP